MRLSVNRKLLRDYRILAISVYISAFVSIATSISSCAGNPPPGLTPNEKISYQSLRVVKGLDLLRDMAITAEAQIPPLITTDAARRIVLFHKEAISAIGAIPDGWKPIVISALTSLESELSDQDKQKFTPYFILVKTLISEVIP